MADIMVWHDQTRIIDLEMENFKSKLLHSTSLNSKEMVDEIARIKGVVEEALREIDKIETHVEKRKIELQEPFTCCCFREMCFPCFRNRKGVFYFNSLLAGVAAMTAVLAVTISALFHHIYADIAGISIATVGAVAGYVATSSNAWYTTVIAERADLHEFTDHIHRDARRFKKFILSLERINKTYSKMQKTYDIEDRSNRSDKMKLEIKDCIYRYRNLPKRAKGGDIYAQLNSLLILELPETHPLREGLTVLETSLELPTAISPSVSNDDLLDGDHCLLSESGRHRQRRIVRSISKAGPSENQVSDFRHQLMDEFGLIEVPSFIKGPSGRKFMLERGDAFTVPIEEGYDESINEESPLGPKGMEMDAL